MTEQQPLYYRTQERINDVYREAILEYLADVPYATNAELLDNVQGGVLDTEMGNFMVSPCALALGQLAAAGLVILGRTADATEKATYKIAAKATEADRAAHDQIMADATMPADFNDPRQVRTPFEDMVAQLLDHRRQMEDLVSRLRQRGDDNAA